MKKNDVRIKKEFSLSEKIGIINIAVDSYFTEDDGTGEVLYTPYYKEIGLVTAFGIYALEGVIFDEDESIYEAITSDIDDPCDSLNFSLRSHYFRWLESIEDILDDIKDMVEFRKAKLLQPKSELEEMFKAINQVLETTNSKLGELDIKGIEKIAKKLNVKELVKAYQNSGIGDGIRDAEIAKLAKENKELKNEITARNVKVQ